MGWTDRQSTLGLILTLSLGVSTLFFVSSDFILAPFFEFFGVATLIVGWFILAPAYYFVTRSSAESERTDAERVDQPDRPTDPVDILQQRYAAGELSESEFERKLDRLLETDRATGDSRDDFGGDELGRTSDALRGDPDRTSDVRGRGRSRDRNRDRDHDLEYE